MKISSTSVQIVTAKTVLRPSEDNGRREPIRVNSDKDGQKASYRIEKVDLRRLDKNQLFIKKRTDFEPIDFKHQKALKTYQNTYFQQALIPSIDLYV